MQKVYDKLKQFPFNNCYNSLLKLKNLNFNFCCQFSSRSAQLHQLWIDAFHDLQANLQTFSSSLALADLNADDNYKLILADLGSGSTHVKLKVWSHNFPGCSFVTSVNMLPFNKCKKLGCP